MSHTETNRPLNNILNKIESQVKTDFERNNRLLSFDDYLVLVDKNFAQHTRGSSQYMLDMFDYFGTRPNPHAATSSTKNIFKLFDMEFSNDPLDKKHRVVGHPEVQEKIYQSLKTFVKEGINNKLILLHGPNGSAKSSIVQCIMKGLEHYSETQDGAAYRFNWIFPIEKYTKGSPLGLGSYASNKEPLKSFAQLSEDEIAAKVSCDLKDHPLLLLNKEARKKIFENQNHADYLTNGNLCHKCKMIYESLLSAYKGDLKKVLMHVQVERFYISKRYRNAAVTIEPQMHVDAQNRQVTMDKSLSMLPASLQSISLFELSGDLVEGNRGIIEYSDLLKRPVDTFKYLLTACETGSISVGSTIAHLDTVLIGSTNELQLDAFKEFPDFTSFKARIELIRVPYLLELSDEKKIYDVGIHKIAGQKHLSPHTTFVAATWAILSRLKKPNPIHYPPNLTNIVAALLPIEKLKLYDTGLVPGHLSSEEKKLLKASIKKLREEYTGVPYYEGRMGASAREIKNILYEAAQNQEFECLSPLAVLRECETFIKRISEYEFLKQDIKDGYHDVQEFINTVRNEYLQLIDQEVRTSMGVFENKQYEDFLKRYILNLSHKLKKEKMKNPITGAMEDPDDQLIEEFEKIIECPHSTAEREHFRNNIISTIGAYVLDHPKETSGATNQAIDYRLVFPDYMKKLEDHYFNQQKAQIITLKRALELFDRSKNESTESLKLAKQTVENMIKNHEYCESCAKEAILFLIQKKY